MNSIFLWRNNEVWCPKKKINIMKCPFCRTLIFRYRKEEDIEPIIVNHHHQICPLCGWYYKYSGAYGASIDNALDDYPIATVPILREFDINSTEVSLSELGSHLRRNYSDIYTISPRRFEQLVDNVFKRHGWRTLLSKQTKDGGVDIFLLTNDYSKVQAIVECKRYKEGRKVGVDAVQRIIGASVDWNTQHAFIVTTSDFSSYAKRKAIGYWGKGYHLDLVAATELLEMLQVFNKSIPSLKELTKFERDKIIRSNKELFAELKKKGWGSNSLFNPNGNEEIQ